jgi:hypothetical protein
MVKSCKNNNSFPHKIWECSQFLSYYLFSSVFCIYKHNLFRLGTEISLVKLEIYETRHQYMKPKALLICAKILLSKMIRCHMMNFWCKYLHLKNEKVIHSIRNASFLLWYINITITILDVIHRPVFYLKHSSTLYVRPYLTGNTLRLRYEPNRWMLSIGLWRWYINITIIILDIIQRDVLETGFCLSSGDSIWRQTESSWNIVFYLKDRTMDVQNCDSHIFKLINFSVTMY